MTDRDKCVVLLSGGQDSTTCTMLAIERFGVKNVLPITFYYKQSHKVEIDSAIDIANALSLPTPEIFDVSVLKHLAGGALTNSEIKVGDKDMPDHGNRYAAAHGLPPTVVPGRNLLFLTVAAAYGASKGIYTLVTGGCLADYEGYPDCRPEFYRAAEDAIAMALDEPSVEIWTPLTDVSKAGTFAIAAAYGKLDIILEKTHTCYNGVHDKDHRHAWGYGCGDCPACQARATGWNEYMKCVNEVVQL